MRTLALSLALLSLAGCGIGGGGGSSHSAASTPPPPPPPLTLAQKYEGVYLYSSPLPAYTVTITDHGDGTCDVQYVPYQDTLPALGIYDHVHLGTIEGSGSPSTAGNIVYLYMVGTVPTLQVNSHVYSLSFQHA